MREETDTMFVNTKTTESQHCSRRHCRTNLHISVI